MKITVKETKETVIDLPIPVFFRNYTENQYLGVLDEKTVVRVNDMDGYMSVVNADIDLYRKEIANAWNGVDKWRTCLESVFLEKYDEVIEKMSLHPILIK